MVPIEFLCLTRKVHRNELTLSSHRPFRKDCLLGIFTSVFLTLAASIRILAIAALISTASLASEICVRGQWLVAGDAILSGFQASGLAVQNDALWSIGDQNSRYPKKLFWRGLDGPDAMLVNLDSEMKLTANSVPEVYRTYLSKQPDFECLASDPSDHRRLYAITEGDMNKVGVDGVPLVVRIDISDVVSDKTAYVTEVRPLSFPTTVDRADDINLGIEGCSVTEDGVFFVSLEMDKFKATQLLYLRITDDIWEGHSNVALTSWPITLGPQDRNLLKNNSISGIAFNAGQISGAKSLFLLGRDKEGLYQVDIASGNLLRTWKLRLLTPSGKQLHKVSPEGLALNARNFWIVNDPWPGMYRYRDESEKQTASALDRENVQKHTPLLFNIPRDAQTGLPESSGCE